ncbi:hypothetical protein [Algoriphagus aquimarinus]|uniref:Uncharacterized protein n=1 Tax=Algoriphagus aquimarinus TaxID=237018 RepID=A0A1I0WB30_9BACT|nr:hypothetical protein [Algoriphagus aquimarinus]SFA85420.1 hypothetical protein SAMN04489723_1025 [Algoriphagus aquimarinus]
MRLAAEKLRLVQKILTVDDDELLSALSDLFEHIENKEALTELQRKEILLGIKQLEEGKKVSLTDFLEKVS